MRNLGILVCANLLCGSCMKSGEGMISVSGMMFVDDSFHMRALRSGDFGSIFGEGCLAGIDRSTVDQLRSVALEGAVAEKTRQFDFETALYAIQNGDGNIMIVYSPSFVRDFDGTVYSGKQEKIFDSYGLAFDFVSGPEC